MWPNVNFKRSKAGLNPEFSFYSTGGHTKVKELSLFYNLPTVIGEQWIHVIPQGISEKWNAKKKKKKNIYIYEKNNETSLILVMVFTATFNLIDKWLNTEIFYLK